MIPIAFNPNMVLKKAYYKDTASYQSNGAAALEVTYTITPETTTNILLGVLWRCDLSATAGNSNTVGLRVQPETGHSGSTQTDKTFTSFKFGKNTAGSVTTHYMWVPFINYDDSFGAENLYNAPQFSGKSTYDVELWSNGLNDANHTVTNIELTFFYLGKATESITKVTKA